MLIAGSLLALVSGMMMALAAALEKREGMRTALSRKGFALLAALAHRPLWVAGVLASALGWVFEAAALTLSPVPVVATLRNAGRGVLVPFGGRWLDEHFSAAELAGVVLTAVGGTVTALGSAGSSIVRSLCPTSPCSKSPQAAPLWPLLWPGSRAGWPPTCSRGRRRPGPSGGARVRLA